MRICMALDGNFPPDVRVEKEVRTLLKEGHEVHLVCKNERNKNNEEVVVGIKVHRLTSLGRLIDKMCGLIYILSFIHFRWFLKIRSVAKKYSIDILHVHDLPLALTTIIVGRLQRIPVIFDSHENWPATICAWNQESLFYNTKRFEKLEMKCVQQANHILTVAEELKQKLSRNGRLSQKITVVSNTADISDISRVEHYFKPSSEKQFLISYCGGFAPDRGLDIFLNAIPFILREFPNLKFLIVGEGEMKDKLIRLAKDLEIEQFVEIERWGKWISYEGNTEKEDSKEGKSFKNGVNSNFVKAMLQSKVGILPYLSNPQRNTTLPHKLFHHMYFKMPVLVSDVKPLRRIVEETKCGIVFRAGDSVNLAEKAIEMVSNPELLEKMGENGRKAVIVKYNWENDARKLIRIYKKFERMRRSR